MSPSADELAKDREVRTWRREEIQIANERSTLRPGQFAAGIPSLPSTDRSQLTLSGTGSKEKRRGGKVDSRQVLVDGHQCIPDSGKGWFCREASIVSRRWPVIVYEVFHDRFPMRDISHAIVVTIVIVITSHLPRPRSCPTSFEKKCQTVILPRVIEKSPCDPRFTSPYSMSANRLNVLVTLIIAVAFLAMESGNAQADGYPQFNPMRPTRNVPQKYCGKKLSNALQIICDGVYNSMFKKSGQEMEMADFPLNYDPLFLSRARARGMLDGPFAGRRYRRQSRGIHEECCINACTMAELSSYCGP